MIRLNGIGHVLLRVSDVERSRAFYSTILGLKVVKTYRDDGVSGAKVFPVESIGMKEPIANDRDAVGRAGPDAIEQNVIGVDAEQQVGEQRIIEDAALIRGGQIAER